MFINKLEILIEEIGKILDETDLKWRRDASSHLSVYAKILQKCKCPLCGQKNKSTWYKYPKKRLCTMTAVIK